MPGNKATLGWYESTRAGGKELFGMHGALQIVELIPINKQKVDRMTKWVLLNQRSLVECRLM